MDDGLIKLIVIAAVLFLSYVSKGLEKKAQRQRRSGGATTPRRKTGLEALAELEKKLREAQRAAEAQTRSGTGAGSRPRPAAVVTTAAQPAPEREEEESARPIASSETVASRHLEIHVGGLEARHLQDNVEARHLDLDVAKAREGHAPILDARPETDLPSALARRTPGARLPPRLTELQRALVWSEVLGPPVALRDGGQVANRPG